jgi:ATP-dependent exoDNAse (exonuclease V) alpha subunit
LENKTKYLNVEFSSQQGFTYSYSGVDFGEETDAKLELAYALTVHKAQGSEFKIVISCFE